jgi:hypothetical protein
MIGGEALRARVDAGVNEAGLKQVLRALRQ